MAGCAYPIRWTQQAGRCWSACPLVPRCRACSLRRCCARCRATRPRSPGGPPNWTGWWPPSARRRPRGLIGIYAVDGMAGIGKTAFAVHAAHQFGARFQDGQIFLRLHAHTAGQRPVDPAEALATLLLTTGVAPQQIPPGLEARSAAWRGHLAGKKVLVVLDDAAGSDQVRPLLPGASGCLVLVTSRRRLTGLEEAAPISLSTLPPSEAADLLVRLAARPGLQSADAAVAEVTGLCGYLPLAIRLVAAGLRHHPAWTVTDLAADLGADRDRLAALQAEDVSVAAAFDLSYQDLTAGQQRLFRRLGLTPVPISTPTLPRP